MGNNIHRGAENGKFTHYLLYFNSLIERYVRKLRIRNQNATGCCPFHPDKTPSLSIDLSRGIWYCHGCNVGGGVRKFSEMIGESWPSSLNRQEKRKWAASLQVQNKKRRAREAAQQSFESWRDIHAAQLQEEQRALEVERAELELYYRISHRWPHLISEDEYLRIVNKLGARYDRLSQSRWDVGFFVDTYTLPNCFTMWQKESEAAHHAV